MRKKKSIEFLGTPGSGKTYYYNKLNKILINDGCETHDFQSLFLNYHHQNQASLNYFKFKIKNFLNSSNIFLFKYLNIIFDKIFIFEKEINKIINKKKNKKFLKKYFKNLELDKSKDNNLRNKLLKWLRNEITGIEIFKQIKNKNLILINSEGINQRISRLLLNKSKLKIIKNIKKLNYNKFESDILIYIDTDSKQCEKRLKKRRNKRFTVKELDKFDYVCRKIYESNKKIKFLIKNINDFNKMTNKLNEYISH